jgi:hypothetical protein
MATIGVCDPFDQIPSFFRQACEAAKLGVGYFLPGYRLMTIVQQFVPRNCDSAKWQIEICQLALYIENDDAVKVVDWFQQHFPSCMELVPSRRHGCFVRGVYQRATEDVDLDRSDAEDQSAA